MKKVYLVWYTRNVGEYEDEETDVVCVFSSRKKAEKYILEVFSQIPEETAKVLKIDREMGLFQFQEKTGMWYDYWINEREVE